MRRHKVPTYRGWCSSAEGPRLERDMGAGVELDMACLLKSAQEAPSRRVAVVMGRRQ